VTHAGGEAHRALPPARAAVAGTGSRLAHVVVAATAAARHHVAAALAVHAMRAALAARSGL